MTTFEGMCIGFLAGVVGTLICVLGGALIDGYLNNHDSDGSDLPVGVGIGAAITDRIITEEETDDKDTTEAIRGSDDRAGSKDLMDI